MTKRQIKKRQMRRRAIFFTVVLFLFSIMIWKLITSIEKNIIAVASKIGFIDEDGIGYIEINLDDYDHDIIREDVNNENDEWVELIKIVEESVAVPAPDILPEITIFETENLPKEIQIYAYEKCQEYDFPFEVFMALMYRESSYKYDAYNPDGSYGLSQVNIINHEWLNEELGLTDFYDPYQNIEGGLFILNHYREIYRPDNMHQLLMMYNMGPSKAKKCFQEGIYSSKYSRAIINHAHQLGYNE